MPGTAWSESYRPRKPSSCARGTRRLALILAIIALSLAALAWPDLAARAQTKQSATPVLPSLTQPQGSTGGSTTPTPPSEPTKVPDFVSRLDDRQARAVLLETLGQRAAAGKPEETDSLGDVFGAAARTARQATGRLATLGRSIGEAPDAMRLAFTYLGIAPAGLVPIAIILAAIVLGAAGVEGLVRLVSSRRSRARREARGGRVRLRLVLAARGLAVLAFAVAAGAGVGIAANIIEPSLLQVVAALAAGIVAVRFAQAFALTALDILMPEARGRGLRLHRRIAATHFAVLHVIVVFGLLFLTTLRHAQADYELRLLCGLLLWTIFCGVALGALARLLPLTAAHAPSREVSEGLVITWLRGHWFGIAVAATVLLWGMTSVAALATGIGELRTGVLTALVLTYAPVIIGFVTAALKRSVPKGDSRSPRALWAVALIRCARVGGALAAGALLARIWQIDPVGLASDRLGERVAGAFANVLVVVLVAYVAWEIVKAIVRGQLGDRDEGPVMPGEDRPAARQPRADLPAAAGEIPARRAAARRRARGAAGDGRGYRAAAGGCGHRRHRHRLWRADLGARHRVGHVLPLRRRLPPRRICRDRPDARHGGGHLHPQHAHPPSSRRDPHRALRHHPAPHQLQPRLDHPEAGIPAGLRHRPEEGEEDRQDRSARSCSTTPNTAPTSSSP